jgi:hypothetical protein
MVEIMLIALLIYRAPLLGWFEHLPLPPGFWALLAVYPIVLYGLERIRKSLVRRVRRKHSD